MANRGKSTTSTNDDSKTSVPVISTTQSLMTPVNPEVFNNWLKSLYTQDVSEQEIKDMYNVLKYQGFDRNEVLQAVMKLGLSKKILSEVILVCALRGPVQASKTPLTNGQTLSSMGITPNAGKGRKVLTCGKITAATADLAAYYLKIVNVPKRISDNELPGWLQFPAAGSIKLPSNYRQLHMKFSKDFSKKIGGEFNEQIYQQMEDNSYLDENLHLF